jgi:putative membrane protein
VDYVETNKHKYYPVFLLVTYAFIWILLAINPSYRHDWLLENILVLIFVPVLIWTYRKFRLSNISYTLIFLFMVLHSFGAHYTYAEVPLGFWLQSAFGLSRNHFDRIVHFSFGLLLAYPVREVFLRIASTKGVWGYWLPVELTLAFSAIFEVFEWLVVVSVNPEAGAAYLGTQGDEFDAIKDMALAGFGAFIAMMITLLVNWHYDKHFTKEMEKSLEIKANEPLGEVKLEELRAEQAIARVTKRVRKKKPRKKR